MIAIFDPKITRDSPAGSCLLKMLQAACDHHRFELFTTQTDLKPTGAIRIHRMPVPAKPVLFESVLFTISSVLYRIIFNQSELALSTQGGFPFCDISYAHCCHKLFLTRYRDRITGNFFVRTARLLNHAWSSVVEAIAFRRARVIVVPSSGLAHDLLSAYGAKLSPKLRIIANPVACQDFAPPQHVKPSAVHPFTFAFCALGNFDWKGLPLIMNALPHVPGAHLLVIGGNKPEIERFEALAASIQLTDRVAFTGLQRDIRSYLWSSDVFVFPSLHESFSLVCLQAAAAGLPLIATDLHGLEELVQPGITGWKIDRTIPSLTDAMLEAAADPTQTREMGKRAQSAARQYDESMFRERWLCLLAELTRSESAHAPSRSA